MSRSSVSTKKKTKKSTPQKIHIPSTPTTIIKPATNQPTPSSNITIEAFEKLIKRVEFLEGKLARLEGHLSLASHCCNKVLRDQLDELQQYSRRSCLIVRGIPVSEKETITDVESKLKALIVENLDVSEQTFDNEIDKAHRIGGIKDDGSQNTIVRFKSHSFRSKLYQTEKHKKNRSSCMPDKTKI